MMLNFANHIRRVMQYGLSARAAACLCVFAMASPWAAAAVTPANTSITNTVSASWTLPLSNSSEQTSADVTFVTEEISAAGTAPTPSELTLAHFLPGSSDRPTLVEPTECADNSGNFSVVNQISDLGNNAYATPGSYVLSSNEYGYKIGEPLMIQLTDLDKNLNSVRPDQIEVVVSNSQNSDTEKLRLTESGDNTGIFIGFIATAAVDSSSAPYDCTLSLKQSQSITVSYEDNIDSTDVSSASTRFDPYSRIFDAQTGEPINGVKVTLIDVATDEAATVYDDDGVTPWPSTVTTGPVSSAEKSIQATDLGYFPDGSFRFPYVPAGEYRLQFEAPDNYRVPSDSSDDDLSAVPNGPYEISGISKGESFTLSSGRVFYADIAADRLDGNLLLSKVAGKQEAGIGDFIEFTLYINNGDVNLTDAILHDQLPPGMRYRSGSTHVNDEKVADPAIDNTGRKLEFALPDIAADARAKLTYVVQITNNAHDTLTNTAWISDDLISSNTAQASVKIIDEFMKDSARLFGRVYLDDCNGNLEADAVSNIRLYMEDGTYVVTDANGEWHIENVRPGTHVVQLDTATVPPYMEVMTCDQRGFHAGRSFSQFVDVQPGSFWRVDFALKMKQPENGEVTQKLSHELIPLNELDNGRLPYGSPVPQKLRYTLQLSGKGVEINNFMQMISLPEGVVYEAGSTVLDGEPWPDPQISYSTLIYKLGDKPKVWEHELVFTAVVSNKARSGELVARAVARFQADNQAAQSMKPVATSAVLQLPPEDGLVKPINPPKFANFADQLTEEDKINLKNVIDSLTGLRNLKVEVVGHTDSTPIARRNKHIYADNQALSEARANSVAQYIAEQLGVDRSQILSAGKGASQPVASNGSALGRAKNRRVEVKVLNGEPDIRLATIASDIQIASIQSALPGFINTLPATSAGGDTGLVEEEPMPEFNARWFTTAADEAQWLWPPVDRSPAISSVKIAISHARNERVRLLLEDKPVSPLNYDGLIDNSQRDLVVSIWRGIDLQPGPNRFTVMVIDDQGNISEEFERNVQFAQIPAKAEIVAEKSQLIADGITAPVIAVRLTDKDGFPIRPNAQGEVDIADPYMLLSDAVQIEGNPLGEVSNPGYRVGKDGIALIRLAPTSQAGEALVRFRYTNGQKDELRVWLKPAPRDWILVGLGDLAVGYNASSGNSSSRSAAGVDDNLYHDGRLAFFAQGQVLGEWLLTAAYDSGKPAGDAFAQIIEPDRYYTLYGDASQQQLDASSARKLYVRLERERFYAMFGDINTDLNVTTLGRYNRKLTGAQAVYQGDMIEFSGFISQADTGFVRDEIQGDGTSGLYRLSNTGIVTGSESISIEVRDRYRNEIIVESKELVRDTDYVIDYEDGTIYFKGPVSSTDSSFNPRYIVAEYEVDGNGKMGYISGGRAGIKLLDDRIKAGITNINQNQSGNDRRLTAADASISLGDTEIRAELAQSQEVVSGTVDPASAQLVEVTHRSESLEAKAYVRRQEDGFGLDQTSSADNDYRKEGIEGSLYLGARDKLDVETFHHQQLSSGDDSYQAEVEWTRQLNNSQQVSLGVLGAQEEDDESTLYTEQATAGFSTRVLNDRLTLTSKILANLSERSDAEDQLRLGADYRLTQDVSLYAEHERGFSNDAPERTVFGVRATPWQGASAEQSIEQVEEDDAYRLFAVSGLNQDIILSDSWSASLGFDQARNLEANAPGETSDSTEDFYALYTGMAYRTSLWQWNGRVEYREGSQTDKWVARTSIYHPLTDALAIGGSLDYFTENANDGFSNQLDSTFDLALRPRKTPVALLWQTRWVQQNEGIDGETPSRSRKLINNLHANWLITPSDQLAGQYGVKRVLDQYNSDNYASTTDFMAAEWRHHLNERWDVGAHGRRLHSYEAGQSQHGTGVSVGWIPKTNVWLGLGYNFSGFIDTDFSAANYTAKGVFLKMRFKADQETLASLRAAFR